MQVRRSNFLIDLHCHTTRSDGADTPWELIRQAQKAGMKIIAITDHDVRPPEKITEDGMEFDIEEYAAGKGIVLLRGIEISCETTVEDCHIVCFGCDWSDSFFVKLEEDIVLSKIESYRQLVRKLTDFGMPVTWEEVLENGGYPITEEQVQKKMIFELLARKGYVKDWSAAKLLVKNTPEFQVLRRKPDPAEVIRQVHRCGGIAIMAHPYLINDPVHYADKTVSRTEYIEYLIDAGLDGIEANYPYEKTSYAGVMGSAEIEQEVRKKYASKIPVISGGSDYHADVKKGAKKVRNLGEGGLDPEEFGENKILQGLVPECAKNLLEEYKICKG